MATSSYPSDGIDGLTISDWADFFASRDGGAENYLPTSLALTRIDSGSVCRISAGNVDINGYRLQVTSDTDLTCPTPTSGSATYYIVAYYDPNLNVADSSGNAPEAGPCRLGLYASTDIEAALAGKTWVLLYRLVRTANQPLNSAVLTPYVKFLGGPTVEWPTSMGDAPTGANAFPRGTLRAAPDSRKLMLRTPVAGAMAWMDLLNAGPFAFPAPSALVANSGPPQYFIHSGVMVKCRGTLKRSSGTLSQSSNDVTLGTFPVGLRPLFTERVLCKTGAGKGYIEVRINPDGTVVMTGETGVDWIDLSSISFRAEQ